MPFRKEESAKVDRKDLDFVLRYIKRNLHTGQSLKKLRIEAIKARAKERNIRQNTLYDSLKRALKNNRKCSVEEVDGKIAKIIGIRQSAQPKRDRLPRDFIL